MEKNFNKNSEWSEQGFFKMKMWKAKLRIWMQKKRMCLK